MTYFSQIELGLTNLAYLTSIIIVRVVQWKWITFIDTILATKACAKVTLFYMFVQYLFTSMAFSDAICKVFQLFLGREDNLRVCFLKLKYGVICEEFELKSIHIKHLFPIKHLFLISEKRQSLTALFEEFVKLVLIIILQDLCEEPFILSFQQATFECYKEI